MPRASRGMGFCFFNNAALAARYAQRRHGLERALIVDWDVHHGNGTEEIFYSDPTVFYFSTHQWPLYPGTGRADETGEGAGVGTTMNFPFPAGSGRKEILGAVREFAGAGRGTVPAGPGGDLGGVRFAPGRSAGPLHPHRPGFRGPHARRHGDRRAPRRRARGLGARRRLQPGWAGLRRGRARGGVVRRARQP